MKNNLLLLSTTLLLLIAQTTLAQNIPSYIPKDGLVGWWPFNGNANDESGNGNNGTVNGATLTSDRFGNAGKAYSFDGVGSNIIIPNSNSLNPSSITMNVWINAKTINPGYILSKRTSLSNPTEFSYSLSATKNQKIESHYGIGQCANYGSGAAPETGGGEYTLQKWIMISSTITSTGQCKIYVNGILDTTINNVPFLTCNSPTTQLQFGFSWPGDPLYFNGTIDDVSIYNRVLSEREIKNLYTGNICYQSVSVTDTLFINSSITSFNPITYENTIKIYPNPSQGQLTIDFGNINTLSGYQMKVINPIGQQIFQSNITQRISTIALSSFSAKGIYFVQLIDSKGEVRENRKIVIR